MPASVLLIGQRPAFSKFDVARGYAEQPCRYIGQATAGRVPNAVSLICYVLLNGDVARQRLCGGAVLFPARRHSGRAVLM